MIISLFKEVIISFLSILLSDLNREIKYCIAFHTFMNWIKNMNDDLSDLNLETASLTKEMESLRERYQKRFGAMESAVSQLKDTGEYLTSFMDSWTAGLKK